MSKILINTKFGGFNFSNKALLKYLEHKGTTGITFHCTACNNITNELIYPEITREKYLVQDLRKMEHYVYDAHIRVNGERFDSAMISRTDPVAIQMVEELGSEFCSAYNSCVIVEEYDNSLDCVICEYDGCEEIEQKKPRKGTAPGIYTRLVDKDEWCR